MPHLPVPRLSRDELARVGDARWNALGTARPDLEPAVALQRTLLNLVIDIDERLALGRLPRLSMPPRYLAAKLVRGVPVLAGEPIPLPVAALKDPLLRMCDALAEGGAADAAVHVRQALAEETIDPGSLLAASLARDQDAIRTGAIHAGLAPDLLWLVAELAVGPVAHALQRSLFGDDVVRTAVDSWEQGYCPACGSWPALAEVVCGERALRCSFCATAWSLSRRRCIYCDEQGDALVVATPEPDRIDRRLELCATCGGYLKTVDAAELSPYPLLAVADLETMHLDGEAMARGYGRPPMKVTKKT
jgi:FdhE protein